MRQHAVTLPGEEQQTKEMGADIYMTKALQYLDILSVREPTKKKDAIHTHSLFVLYIHTMNWMGTWLSWKREKYGEEAELT